MWTRFEARQVMMSFVEAVPGGRFEVRIECGSDDLLLALEITRGAECAPERVLDWLETFFRQSAASAYKVTQDANRVRLDRIGLRSRSVQW